MDEEPDQHFQIDLFAAERQAFPDQMGDPKPQCRVKTFNVLGAPNDVQRSKNDTSVDGQAVGVTLGFEVGGWETLPQAKGSDTVAPPNKTADDLAGKPVHCQPNPSGLCLLGHKGAQFVALQHQRRWCWSAHVFDDTTSAGSAPPNT